MKKNKERLFVIMEVEEGDSESIYTKEYLPVDNKGAEIVYLNPSRIIPASRLRYGVPKRDETYFQNHFWNWAGANINFPGNSTRLILGPEPGEEKSEFDKWVEDCPACDPAIKDWIKKMPREDT